MSDGSVPQHVHDFESTWRERFRAALMAEHAHDQDMETISEAAHVCARAMTEWMFGSQPKTAQEASDE